MIFFSMIKSKLLNFVHEFMKYLLHIDTSADKSMVLLSRGGLLVGSIIHEGARDHAQMLHTLIGQTLEKAGLAFADLGGVVVCAGPGSYTGLRIGMAAAKGICYAMDIPLYLHNRLTLIAWQQKTSTGAGHTVAVVLQARDREYFVARYDEDFREVCAPLHISHEQLIEIKQDFDNSIIISDIVSANEILAELHGKTLISDSEIKAENWAKFMEFPFYQNVAANLFSAEPFYLKDVYTHK
jgi:tRNA threonylcarbamoyladenosine biosynthesis protein TsaB